MQFITSDKESRHLSENTAEGFYNKLDDLKQGFNKGDSHEDGEEREHGRNKEKERRRKPLESGDNENLSYQLPTFITSLKMPKRMIEPNTK